MLIWFRERKIAKKTTYLEFCQKRIFANAKHEGRIFEFFPQMFFRLFEYHVAKHEQL